VHFRERGFIAEQEHPLMGRFLTPNLPWHFARHPDLDAEVPPAPLLGADNRRYLPALPSATSGLLAAVDRCRDDAIARSEAGQIALK
jgi:hypothetical protein